LKVLDDVIKQVITQVTDYDYVKSKVSGEYVQILNDEIKRKGRIIEIKNANILYIIGDIHGDLNTLRHILSKVSIDSLRKGDIGLVFLGDYIDRGLNQLEVFTSVLEIKSMFPDSITLLRGNHEPPKNLIPYPHDFPNELVMRFGYDRGLRLYEEFSKLFDLLPHVAYVRDQILMVHGGLPTVTYQRAQTLYEYFTGINERDYQQVLEEVLWNDPIEANIVSTPSPRGAGQLFGLKVTEWFTKKFNFKLIVRGHEPIDSGYKFNHRDRVLTLFSRLGPPYFNTSAAYLNIRLDIADWFDKVKSFIKLIQAK